MKCSHCKMVRYCPKECQASHWKKEHKEDCQSLLSARESMRDDSVALPEKGGDRIFAIQNRGARYMQLGNVAAAEREFRLLLDEGFTTTSTYVNLASTLIYQGRVSEALPYAKLSIQPAYTKEDRAHLRHAYHSLGQVHLMLKDKPAAVKVLQKALGLYPDDAEFQMLLKGAD